MCFCEKNTKNQTQQKSMSFDKMCGEYFSIIIVPQKHSIGNSKKIIKSVLNNTLEKMKNEPIAVRSKLKPSAETQKKNSGKDQESY